MVNFIFLWQTDRDSLDFLLKGRFLKNLWNSGCNSYLLILAGVKLRPHLYFHIEHIMYFWLKDYPHSGMATTACGVPFLSLACQKLKFLCLTSICLTFEILMLPLKAFILTFQGLDLGVSWHKFAIWWDDFEVCDRCLAFEKYGAKIYFFGKKLKWCENTRLLVVVLKNKQLFRQTTQLCFSSFFLTL